MSKGKANCGKAIGFRLSLKNDMEFRKAASELHKSPGQFAKEIIEAYFSEPDSETDY